MGRAHRGRGTRTLVGNKGGCVGGGRGELRRRIRRRCDVCLGRRMSGRGGLHGRVSFFDSIRIIGRIMGNDGKWLTLRASRMLLASLSMAVPVSLPSAPFLVFFILSSAFCRSCVVQRRPQKHTLGSFLQIDLYRIKSWSLRLLRRAGLRLRDWVADRWAFPAEGTRPTGRIDGTTHSSSWRSLR